MMMESSSNDTVEMIQETDSGSIAKENMAPLENDAALSDSQNEDTYQSGKGYMSQDDQHLGGKYGGFHPGDGNNSHNVMSTDDGEGDTAAEDGEILEDGEIASDQDGELLDDEDEFKPSPTKSSPSKGKGGHKDEDRERSRRNKKDRHSKRRRSKEDGHKDKQQKKKRHREYIDYDKTGDDYDQAWIGGEKRDKVERKGERSPPPSYHDPGTDGDERYKHEKDSEKHRRGSGEGRHHSGRDRERGRERDQNREKHKNRDLSKDRSEREKREKDKHDKSERDKDKKGRDRYGRDTRENRERKNHSDGYDSPPGIYDSPSDEEEYGERFSAKKPKTMMSMVEGEYMDPSMVTNEMEQETFQPMLPKVNKKKQKKKQEWLERQRQREIEYEEEAPVKKKPLLLTPMEERPICRFYKEGKCQKGADCPFNHGCRPPKRLELCKYYVQSYCRKQEECVFMHAEFPCKYFHTGSTCYQGDNCKFSHDPLTEVTKVALHNALNDRNEREENYHDEYDDGHGEHKRKKKGMMALENMTQADIEMKLEQMKSIPSIFDIETYAPTDSPRKPKMGQSPNMMRPQGFYQDVNMSPQGGPNMRFNGPMNQGTPPRPPFMNGPPGPGGMDGPPPPMGMQGPPMGGPGGPQGPGMIGQGPPPGMGPGMQGPPQGPGMQGAPMGPPMSQAAALVGALLRAAPMLQQIRGGPPNSMGNNMNNDGNFMGQGPPLAMGMMGPQMGNMGQGPMMSPGQMDQGNLNNSDGMMGAGPQNNMEDGGQAENQGHMNEMNKPMNQSRDPRDPRKMTQEGKRAHPVVDTDMRGSDVDMRAGPGNNQGSSESMGDEDLRRDVDLRQDENSSNKGDTTPQQDWEDEEGEKMDDMDIPSHLPPKQREMFMRIKQHTMKMNRQKAAEAETAPAEPKPSQTSIPTIKMEDSWYSSDEEDDVKPNVSLHQATVKSEPETSVASSLSVMQMINAIKNSSTTATTTTSAGRPVDPRKQSSDVKPSMPPREPTIINSREGDCPWRLCKVLYVKQRIPDNVELTDPKYKNDPRVQKILKLQELESGKVIDHSKTDFSKTVKTEPGDPKLPLLDPRVLQAKEPSLPRPELTPFVDPRVKSENSDPRIKQEPGIPSSRPMDPRLKSAQDVTVKPIDPRVQKMNSGSVPGVHNLPVRPLDPRLSRQDSNSLNPSTMGTGRLADPRLSRQASRDGPVPAQVSRSSTPPMDPRQFNRQNSGDLRLTKADTLPIETGSSVSRPFDPRLSRVTDTESGMQRQMSLPGTSTEKEAASEPQKPKVDYRNDPRFKRKHISESNLPPEVVAKRFTGQRKSSTEYSSPLGGETSKSEDSGYNSYNRPRPVVKPNQTSQLPAPTAGLSDNVPAPSSDITTHDILDSLQIMPPPTLDKPPAPDKNLKDIFKTIDPTASPFC